MVRPKDAGSGPKPHRHGGAEGRQNTLDKTRTERSKADDGDSSALSATIAKGHAQAEQGRPADASKTVTSQEKPTHATAPVTNRTRDAAHNLCTIPGKDVPGLQGSAAEGAQGGSMRGSGGMPSKRCSADKGQPCRGATHPKLARVQTQATRPTSPRPNKQKPHNLAPAARGRYKPCAGRAPAAAHGLSNALGGKGHRMRGSPAQRQHGGGRRAAEDLAVAPAGLEDPERHDGRAVAQPVERHAHVILDERGNAYEVALHGAAAVVQNVAGHPCGRGWLRASGRRAAARGAPQVPEGGEAKPRPERLQVQIDRPGAVVASEEHRRGDRRRRPPNDRTPHLRRPCHHRARNDTVQKDVT